MITETNPKWSPWRTMTTEELEQDLVDQGYDLDKLERDNPYNQWMYEDE